MKKIIRKLFAPIALLSLALGVGISLNNHRDVIKTEAAEVTTTFGATSGTIGTEWKFSTAQNDGTNPPYWSGSDIRLYYNTHGNGGSILFEPNTPGFKMTEIVITASSTSYTPTPGVKYGETAADTDVTLSWSSTTLTYSNPSGFKYFRLQNANTSNKQLRIKSAKITYSVDAGDKVLQSIASSGTLEKKNYYVGDTFDPTGLAITATFDDNSTADVTSETTFNPNPLTLGLTEVTASVEIAGVTKTTTITGITVTEVPTLEIIVIGGSMNKTEYMTTDSWDPAGLTVTAMYSNGTEPVVTDDVTWSYSPATPNDTSITSVTVTATYQGETDSATYNVTVTEKVSTVVISEVYGGGGNSGSKYKRDFVELYNNTDSAINITGWVVFYANATGVFRNDSNTHLVLEGTILPRSYFLIGMDTGSGGDTDLPTPDQDGSIAMGGSAIKIALTNTNAAPETATDANVIDLVGAATNASIYEGTSSAPAPSNTTSVFRTFVDGVAVDTDDNGADFTAGAPTPRNSALAVAEKIMESDTEMQCVTKFPEMKSKVLQLTPAQLSYFQSTGTEPLMVSARARYVAWAAYLGDNEAYGTGSPARSTTTNSSSNNVAAIALIGVIGITTLVGYYFINKKRLTA